MEVDVGQNRCGVRSPEAAADLADAITRHRSLRFAGLQGYQGKLQGIISPQERGAAVLQAMQGLQEAAALVRARGHKIEVLTGGGTGSVRFDLDLRILQELQPGSYVFMDASYRKIGWDEQGSPPPFRPALTVLTVCSASQRRTGSLLMRAGRLPAAMLGRRRSLGGMTSCSTLPATNTARWFGWMAARLICASARSFACCRAIVTRR